MAHSIYFLTKSTSTFINTNFKHAPTVRFHLYPSSPHVAFLNFGSDSSSAAFLFCFWATVKVLRAQTSPRSTVHPLSSFTRRQLASIHCQPNAKSFSVFTVSITTDCFYVRLALVGSFNKESSPLVISELNGSVNCSFLCSVLLLARFH